MTSYSGSLLLNTLSPETLARLDVREEEQPLASVLIKPAEVSDSVFFPHRGALVSIVRTMENGSTVEIGVVGGEGFFSVHSLLTDSPSLESEALVQTDGRFSRVKIAGLRAQFNANADFRELLLTYTSIFLDQVTQNAVCNRLHPIEQRLAKWLLVVRNRVGTDELRLTHDFLSHMLGVHRPGVSLAVNALALDGIIENRRNHIVIRDATGLAGRSCECYAPLNKRFDAFTAKLEKLRSAVRRNH